MRRALVLSGLSLGLGLGCGPELSEVVTPGGDWPDLAQAPELPREGRGDAALILAIEDPALGGRPGAHAVASGWWRYFVEGRGLRRTQVTLLRDGEASAPAISRALARLEARADTGSALWLVFIGSGSSPADGSEGRLAVARGEQLAFAELRGALGRGFHESAVMIVDACDAQPGPGRRAGLPATPQTPGPRQFAARREAYIEAMEAPELERYAVDEGGEAPLNGLSSLARQTLARVEADQRREAGTARNTFVLTAGVGSSCTDALGGQPWPALSYLALAGLQGRADTDGDARVGAVELSIHVQAILDASTPEGHERPRLSADGVDLVLGELWAPGGAALAPSVDALGPTQPDPAALDEAAAGVVLAIEDMVSVPAGAFVRGCPRDRRGPDRRRRTCEKDERPARSVSLDAFAIDRLEVSWADYRACVDVGLCRAPRLDRCWVWTGDGFVEGARLPELALLDDHPAVCISWEDASDYCEAVAKRLPTEAEWERAARGTDSRTYPWGEQSPTCAHAVMDGCGGHSFALGTRPEGASPVGALDMSGNVSEWVFDWWSEVSYLYARSHDPKGASVGEVRVVRGGSFYDSDEHLRAGYRYGIDPSARLSTLGFRCAR